MHRDDSRTHSWRARKDRHRQAVFWTLPLRIHRVHTRIRVTPPPIAARTSCRLGFHRRLVLLLAWLTLLPTEGRFPQIAQFLMLLTLATSEAAPENGCESPSPNRQPSRMRAMIKEGFVAAGTRVLSLPKPK